jgi:hypothetical protein
MNSTSTVMVVEAANWVGMPIKFRFQRLLAMEYADTTVLRFDFFILWF